MKVVWFSSAWTDYLFWQNEDREIAAKINTLLEDVRRSPFRGLGKPEPLRERLSGWWSRRITQEHRLVYRVAGSGDDQRVEILACRFHY
ncbi:Txe/YoeB family addiction module toxin [Methylopila sp. M107]|uniref:Txe/YoeB family addiction module toxin n=1 Tax=Methylopila sp. M107 TaxID=1101190 RepID=UPI00035F4E7D|nr:Txe/YoeB family addiction module toxin [Methylopila sp. M107]